jgi:hypothetical protein
MVKSLLDERTLKPLVDKYLERILAKARSGFDSSSVIVKVELGTSARMEDFRPYWLNQMAKLKRSDSLDFVFYDSLFKVKLKEHMRLNRFRDSISFFKNEIRVVESKLDSAKRGLFGNPILGQFKRLSEEKGNIYFLLTDLIGKEEQTMKMNFVIQELEHDTIITWTTVKKLSEFMSSEIYRRNPSFWTKRLREGNIKKAQPNESSS